MLTPHVVCKEVWASAIVFRSRKSRRMRMARRQERRSNTQPSSERARRVLSAIANSLRWHLRRGNESNSRLLEICGRTGGQRNGAIAVASDPYSPTIVSLTVVRAENPETSAGPRNGAPLWSTSDSQFPRCRSVRERCDHRDRRNEVDIDGPTGVDAARMREPCLRS
jgi:hypothetical protein